jgi:maltooligosyltrehalose synthase
VTHRFPTAASGETAWLRWPESLPRDGRWRDLLTGRVADCNNDGTDVGTLLAELPVALLIPA